MPPYPFQEMQLCIYKLFCFNTDCPAQRYREMKFLIALQILGRDVGIERSTSRELRLILLLTRI